MSPLECYIDENGNQQVRSLGPRFADSSDINNQPFQYTTPQGMPARQITPDTIVTIPGTGMQTSVANAQRLGLLPKPGVEGAPSAPPAPMSPDPQQQQQAAPQTALSGAQAPQDQLLSPDVVQAVSDIYSQHGEAFGDSLVNALISDLGSEDGVSTRVDAVALQNGIYPKQVRGAVAEIAASFEQVGVKYLQQITGDSGEEVLEWAKGKFDLDSFRQVARLQFYGNSLAGYDAIAREWRQHKLVEYHKSHPVA